MHWENDCPHREIKEDSKAAATVAALAQDDYDSEASAV
jgi:hypothetical protein